MTKVVVFDQAESFGGSIARILDVIEDTPSLNYLILGYLPKDEILNGRKLNNLEVKRLKSFFNYQRKIRLKNKLTSSHRALFIWNLFILKSIALLDFINEKSVTFQMNRELKTFEPNVLVSNSNIHAVPMNCSKDKPFKHIVIFRSLDILSRWLYKIDDIDEFVSISKSLEDIYINQLHLPKSKCSVIGDPVDAEYELAKQLSASAGNQDSPPQEEKFTFLQTARICLQKGQLDACKAFQQSSLIDDCQLILVGGVDPDPESTMYKEEIEGFIQIHHLEDKIKLIGHRNDPLILMNNANVILHCATQFEGLGSAVIEAMQLRKIVIASDNGGPASFIEHSKNGFLYRSSDIKDLQSNLEHVFREFSGLRNIENQAFQDSYLMFSRETISNQFLGIFQDNQGTNSEVH